MLVIHCHIDQKDSIERITQAATHIDINGSFTRNIGKDVELLEVPPDKGPQLTCCFNSDSVARITSKERGPAASGEHFKNDIKFGQLSVLLRVSEPVCFDICKGDRT